MSSLWIQLQFIQALVRQSKPELLCALFVGLTALTGCTQHSFSSATSAAPQPGPVVHDNLTLVISGITPAPGVTSATDPTPLISTGQTPVFTVLLQNATGAPTSVTSASLTFTAPTGPSSGSGACTYVSAASTGVPSGFSAGNYTCTGFAFTNTTTANLAATVLACLGSSSTCSSPFAFNVAPPTPPPLYKVSLAVRNLACAYCHAQIIGDVVSDFGYNYSTYYSQSGNNSGLTSDSGAYSPWFVDSDLPPLLHSSTLSANLQTLQVPSNQFYGDMLYNDEGYEIFPYALATALISGSFYLPKLNMDSKYFGASGSFSAHITQAQNNLSSPGYVNPLSCTSLSITSMPAFSADPTCTAPHICSSSTPNIVGANWRPPNSGSAIPQCNSAQHYVFPSGTTANLDFALYAKSIPATLSLAPSTLAQYVGTLLNLRTPDFISMLLSYVSTIGSKNQDSTYTYGSVPINDMSNILINPPTSKNIMLSGFSQSPSTPPAPPASLLTASSPVTVSGNSYTVFSSNNPTISTVACSGEYYVDGIVYLRNFQLAAGTQCTIYATGIIVFLVDSNSSATISLPFADADVQKGGSLQLMSATGIVFGYPGDPVKPASGSPFDNLTSLFPAGTRANFSISAVKDQFVAIKTAISTAMPKKAIVKVSLNSVISVAPIVMSQFNGLYLGTIVANFLLPLIGDFYFQQNTSLSSTAIFPSYPQNNYYVVSN
jgi:hypothetical protein